MSDEASAVPETRQPRRVKEWLSKLMMVLLGIVLAIIGIETAGHLVPGLLPPSLQAKLALAADQDLSRFVYAQGSLIQPDPYIGLTIRPDMDVLLAGHPEFTFSVHTERLGNEHVGVREAEPLGDVYAVAVGDSFTFGIGVNDEDLWVTRLEDMIEGEVANLGIPSATSLQYNRVAEQYGIALQPEVMLWEFYPSDSIENVWFNAWLEAGSPDGVYNWEQWKTHMELQDTLPAARLLQFLEQNSVTYNLLLPPMRALYHALPEAATANIQTPSYEQGSMVTAGTIQDGQALTIQSVRDARALAEAGGIELVVLLFPTHDMVAHPEEYVGGMDWLLQFCAEEGIRCVDLTRGFVEHAAQGESLYFEQDGHWTVVGNRLTATLVCEYLRQEALLTDNAVSCGH